MPVVGMIRLGMKHLVGLAVLAISCSESHGVEPPAEDLLLSSLDESQRMALCDYLNVNAESQLRALGYLGEDEPLFPDEDVDYFFTCPNGLEKSVDYCHGDSLHYFDSCVAGRVRDMLLCRDARINNVCVVNYEVNGDPEGYCDRLVALCAGEIE